MTLNGRGMIELVHRQLLSDNQLTGREKISFNYKITGDAQVGEDIYSVQSFIQSVLFFIMSYSLAHYQEEVHDTRRMALPG